MTNAAQENMRGFFLSWVFTRAVEMTHRRKQEILGRASITNVRSKYEVVVFSCHRLRVVRRENGNRISLIEIELGTMRKIVI